MSYGLIQRRDRHITVHTMDPFRLEGGPFKHLRYTECGRVPERIDELEPTGPIYHPCKLCAAVIRRRTEAANIEAERRRAAIAATKAAQHG